MRTSVRRFLSVFLSLCSLREAKKIKIKQATLRPCAISFKLRLPSLEWQCTITPQIATRGCSKTCLEDYLFRLRLWNGRRSIPCLSERRLCLCNKTFEENMQVLSAFIFQCAPPPGVTLSMGVTWRLTTVYHCRDVGRSVLRLAFFRAMAFLK